ncbi:MAG: hypothetical protein ABSH36_01730 [Solirubrobacteraceae bacterium]
MIVALAVMLISSGLVVAAFTAARGDIGAVSVNSEQKKAYYAAEAGIQDYEYHLTQDGNYLSYCTEPPAANPALNQQYKEGTKEPLKSSELHTAEIPESGGERYAIQLIPAESDKEEHPKCTKSNLVESMLEEQGAATGTFRIEATGFYRKQSRSIMATFRNSNFVSYVWYTKYETFDPAKYGEPVRTQCEAFYGKRPGERECQNNYFISGESVNGPMHTEDHVGICGSPIFGRSLPDRIEFGSRGEPSEEEGYSNEEVGSCPASPTFKGTHVPVSEVKQLEPPPGDEELEHVVEPAYKYTGKTEIILEGSTMTVKSFEYNAVTKKVEVKTVPGVAFPPNGVIYVKGGCSTRYSPYGPKPGYEEDTECGNVYVHGEYSNSLTIASQNDIIINGNLITVPRNGEVPASNALLGLVANNFIRIYHPVVKTYEVGGTTCNGHDRYLGSHICEYINNASECDAPNEPTGHTPEDLNNPTIYAAMLALKHSVLVDNYDCGTATLGHLNVYGAVAGLFSNGLTGEFNGRTGVIEHGYPYDANYDNRLQIEEPPHFLNPIQAAWTIQRETLTSQP